MQGPHVFTFDLERAGVSIQVRVNYQYGTVVVLGISQLLREPSTWTHDKRRQD